MTRQSVTQTQQQTPTTNSLSRGGILQRKCQGCGQHTIAGAECTECSKNKSGLQRKLAIGDSNDPLEREADRVADQVLAAPAHLAVSGAPPRIQRYTGQPTGQTDMAAPASVDRILSSSGRPLEPSLRQDMEQRFGHDFSRVRIHTDATAERSARDVNANAYTVGHDIVFRAGRFAPRTNEGRLLLAHELTHVVQQSDSERSLSPIIQRKRKKDADKADKKAPQGASFWFSVKVSSELNSDDLLVEFVRQYYRLASTAEAVKMRDENGWGWTDIAQVATKADVANGYILLHVTDNSVRQQDEASKKESAAQFGQLGASDRSAINSEADREFWEKSQYKVGTKLGSSSDDKKMSEYWLAIRNELVRQRQAIDALPPNIKKFLFKEDAPRAIEPKDYATALRIAEKLSKLTDAELEDYKSKVNTETADWSVFERSIDSFVAERARRKEEAKDLDKKKTKLYGLEELYRKYTTWKSVKGTAASIPAHDEFGVYDPNHQYFQHVEDDAKADLLANLPRYGFKSIEDFEQAITDYEDAFARETVNIGFDMLAKYDHLLYEEEKRYSNKANADALAQAIGKTTAKAYYESAASKESAARGITPEPEIHRYMPGEFEMKQRLQREGASARASAESQVSSAAASVSGVPDPLIGNKDFDREKLARADASQVQSIMLEYIAARRKDIRDTRGHLSDDPDLIYNLDELWKASKEQQDIRPDTIYDLIISDKISHVHKSEALIKILWGVFTVVLSIVSFGTGTVATVAAVGAFGLSAYQAIESFKEYEVGHAAAGAQLLSKDQDPSFAWVIVAFVGAAIDLGVAAKAISEMKGAIDAFNATGDLVKLETELTEIEKAGKITEEMRELTAKAAAAQKEYRAAMKGLAAKTLGRANAMLPLDAIPDLAKAIYYAAKRGVASFEKFMLELKADKAYAELALEPEELTKFKAAFEEAKTAAESVVSHGQSLGLKENQIDAFMEMWAKNKGTLTDLKQEMSTFAATKQGGLPSSALTKESIIVDENVVIARGKSPADLQPGEKAMLDRQIAEATEKLEKLKAENSKTVADLKQQRAANQQTIQQFNQAIDIINKKINALSLEAYNARKTKAGTKQGSKLIEELTTNVDEKLEIARARKAGIPEWQIQDKVLRLKSNELEANKLRPLERQRSEKLATQESIKIKINELEGITKVPDKAGGSHQNVRDKSQGGEVNHMPAHSAFDGVIELKYGEGPAIWMTKEDHMKTTTWGPSDLAKKHREKQQELIQEGKFKEALQMDIDDIRAKFPDGRYEKGIQQLLAYVNVIASGKLKPKVNPSVKK